MMVSLFQKKKPYIMSEGERVIKNIREKPQGFLTYAQVEGLLALKDTCTPEKWKQVFSEQNVRSKVWFKADIYPYIWVIQYTKEDNKPTTYIRLDRFDNDSKNSFIPSDDKIIEFVNETRKINPDTTYFRTSPPNFTDNRGHSEFSLKAFSVPSTNTSNLNRIIRANSRISKVGGSRRRVRKHRRTYRVRH